MCQVCHRVIYIPGWDVYLVSREQAERGERRTETFNYGYVC